MVTDYMVSYDLVNLSTGASVPDSEGASLRNNETLSAARMLRSRARPRPASPQSPPSVGLGLLLRNADMTFNRALREELLRFGITFSQFQHLRHLWKANGLTQVALSRRIGIATASSTAVLDSLQKLRLVRRMRDGRDRRKINVFLTPAGAALERPLMGCAIAVNADARHGLSTAEVATLFAIVEKIVVNLRTRRSARDDFHKHTRYGSDGAEAAPPQIRMARAARRRRR
jgi:MarR family transcriptional regulator, organic hydroperoxide resistance regulator